MFLSRPEPSHRPARPAGTGCRRGVGVSSSPGLRCCCRRPPAPSSAAVPPGGMREPARRFQKGKASTSGGDTYREFHLTTGKCPDTSTQVYRRVAFICLFILFEHCGILSRLLLSLDPAPAEGGGKGPVELERTRKNMKSEFSPARSNFSLTFCTK